MTILSFLYCALRCVPPTSYVMPWLLTHPSSFSYVHLLKFYLQYYQKKRVQVWGIFISTKISSSLVIDGLFYSSIQAYAVRQKPRKMMWDVSDIICLMKGAHIRKIKIVKENSFCRENPLKGIFFKCSSFWICVKVKVCLELNQRSKKKRKGKKCVVRHSHIMLISNRKKNSLFVYVSWRVKGERWEGVVGVWVGILF